MTRRAFTLIELLIAVLILSVVLVSIYGAFSVGIKAWQRGNQSRGFQKTRIALLKMQKELRSSFFFSNIPFKGSSSEVVFPAAVNEGDKYKIYSIKYYVEADKNTGVKALIKRKSAFVENRSIEEDEKTKEFVFSCYSIDFEYPYELDGGVKGFEWRNIWPESQKKLPYAVKVNFSAGQNEAAYHKIIFIPQGELGKK